MVRPCSPCLRRHGHSLAHDSDRWRVVGTCLMTLLTNPNGMWSLVGATLQAHRVHWCFTSTIAKARRAMPSIKPSAKQSTSVGGSAGLLE